MSHTPGPWKWEKYYQGLIGSNRQPVLDFESYEGMSLGGATLDEEKANGDVIEAAPDLLKALEAIVPLAEYYLKITKSIGVEEKIEFALSAIAKAKGQS